MAKHRIKNVVCTVTKSSGGSPVTLTDRLDYAAFERMADELEATTMASDGHEEWLGGFEGGFVELVFQQDFDAGQVNDTLKDELGKIITVELQPNPNGQTTVSPTNPKWTCKCLVSRLPEFGGRVKQLSRISLRMRLAGRPVRSTTP